MKKHVLTFILVAATSAFIASANAQSGKLFSCIDSASLTVDSNCVASQISKNPSFQASQQAFFNNLEQQGGAEISSLSFYPKLNLIKVVAPRPVQGTFNEPTVARQK